MRVRWLRGALRNLDQEASYIAPDNPKAAAELVRHLRDSALLTPFLFQNSNNYVGCIPCTIAIGAWNAPYDIALLMEKWNDTCAKLFVPTGLYGNTSPGRIAPRAAGAAQPHSHAGAWER